MTAILQAHLLVITVVGACITLLSLILAVSALLANAGLKRRLKKWRSIHATADLEVVYAQTIDEVERLRGSFHQLEAELKSVRKLLRKKISTAQVLRYNAFAEQGSDLSFSVALLDDDQDGVVLSSIYGREESRTYAKPIRSSVSNYPLTNEEREVLSFVAATDESPGSSVRKQSR